jgi:pimeloyl-ACP methyl ester carboxylesterase
MTRTEEFSYVTASGVRLACQRIVPDGADEAGPTWVFLHEALGAITMWKDFPRKLCEHTKMVGLVYDRQGHGKSDPLLSAERNLDFHGEEARALNPMLTALGITQPVLFGHSDGGTIALKYAAQFPDALVGAMTLAAHTWVEKETLAGVIEARKVWDTTDWRTKLARHHGANTDTVFHAWSDTWQSEAFQSWDMRGELPAITCRLAAIQGVNDQYGSEAQVDAIEKGSTGPCWKLMIPDCGHVPHLEQPDFILEAAVEFLREALKA